MSARMSMDCSMSYILRRQKWNWKYTNMQVIKLETPKLLDTRAEAVFHTWNILAHEFNREGFE